MNRLGRLQSLSDKVKNRAGSPAHPPTYDNGWLARRGDVRAAVDCDVIGNFPGFHQSAALIVSAKTVVTPGYLVVDEGEAHGFALPISAISDVSLDEAPHAGPDLIVRYRQASDSGWFRLRESRGRLRRKGTRGIEAIRAALRASGVSFGETAASFNAFLLMPWDAAASIESDKVIWSGRATAPIRATLECAPTEVWVTSNAVIWGGIKGEGVNRLPLTAIRSLAPIALADSGAAPSIFVSTFGPENIPVSLPFIFDTGSNRLATRDELVQLFSPNLVAEIEATPPSQPWNDPEADDDMDEGDTVPDEDGAGSAGHESDGAEDAADVTLVDRWETWAAARPPARYGFEASGAPGRVIGGAQEPRPFDSSGIRLTEALSVWPTEPAPEPEPEEPGPVEPAAIPAYLAAARHAIAEVNDVIDRRLVGKSAPSPRATPPSTESQAAALAELVELIGAGYYNAEASRAVKVQITRFGEAAIRIRSLLELCNAGHMTIKDAAAKRDSIVATLPVNEAD